VKAASTPAPPRATQTAATAGGVEPAHRCQQVAPEGPARGAGDAEPEGGGAQREHVGAGRRSGGARRAPALARVVTAVRPSTTVTARLPSAKSAHAARQLSAASSTDGPDASTPTQVPALTIIWALS
jgi:hypothetical protein